MTLADEITELFTRRGGAAYFGEPVSMAQHSLQAAYFAQAAAAPPALVLAALLHDVGHLIEDVPEDFEDWKIDARHEEVGGRWLASRFPLSVSNVRLRARQALPVRHHSAYFAAEQRPSSRSVGGPMSPAETGRRGEPFHRVRPRWDDAGKFELNSGADYRALIEALRALANLQRARRAISCRTLFSWSLVRAT